MTVCQCALPLYRRMPAMGTGRARPQAASFKTAKPHAVRVLEHYSIGAAAILTSGRHVTSYNVKRVYREPVR